MVEEFAAAHPVWSDDNEGLKQEFRYLEARVDNWQNLCSRAESDAERVEDKLEATQQQLDQLLEVVKEHWAYWDDKGLTIRPVHPMLGKLYDQDKALYDLAEEIEKERKS